MDPKLVRQGAALMPDEVLSPLQRRAFAIVDGYIEQNIPAVLLDRKRSARYYADQEAVTTDDLVNYQLVIKTNLGYLELLDWQDESKTPRPRRIPPGQVNQDMVAELERQEILFVSQTFEQSDEDLPLSEVDLRAIGLSSDDGKQSVNKDTLNNA